MPLPSGLGIQFSQEILVNCKGKLINFKRNKNSQNPLNYFIYFRSNPKPKQKNNNQNYSHYPDYLIVEYLQQRHNFGKVL